MERVIIDSAKLQVWGVKSYLLKVYNKNGDFIDGTFLYNVIDRKDAIKRAKRLLMYQGISHLKFKLTIQK